MMVSTKGEKNGKVHTTCFAGLSLCGLNDCNLKTVNGKPVDCQKCNLIGRGKQADETIAKLKNVLRDALRP